jgi:hypothetical protein
LARTEQNGPAITPNFRDLALAKKLLQFADLSASERAKPISGPPVAQHQFTGQLLRVKADNLLYIIRLAEFVAVKYFEMERAPQLADRQFSREGDRIRKFPSARLTGSWAYHQPGKLLAGHGGKSAQRFNVCVRERLRRSPYDV